MNTINSFRDFWERHDPKKNEDAKFILSTVIENQKSTRKIYFRSYYLIIILSFVFFCIDSQIIPIEKPVTIFSIEVTNLAAIQWGLCPLICFFFYQGLVAFKLDSSYYSIIISEYVNKYIPEFTELNVKRLLMPPSFLEFELNPAIKGKTVFTKYFGLLVIMVLLVIPFLIIGYIIYKDILLWNNVASLFFKLVVITVTCIFLIRSVYLIAE